MMQVNRIYESCNNYPAALDEIERLQARVEELEEAYRTLSKSEEVRNV